VEDNEADVFLIEEAILATKLPVNLFVVTDGDQAVKFVDRVEAEGTPCPNLVILDINLPKKQGGEVLRHMRRSSKCAGAIVIVVSTSESARDRNEMAGLGANSYFSKPSGYADFMKLSDLIKSFLGSEAAC
jgi:two-component system, chemotaxis family, response regulator Rcp1